MGGTFFRGGRGDGKKPKKRRWFLKGRIYRGNPIVSTPLSNPTHISTERAVHQEKNRKNKQEQGVREEEMYFKKKNKKKTVGKKKRKSAQTG